MKNQFLTAVLLPLTSSMIVFLFYLASFYCAKMSCDFGLSVIKYSNDVNSNMGSLTISEEAIKKVENEKVCSLSLEISEIQTH